MGGAVWRTQGSDGLVERGMKPMGGRGARRGSARGGVMVAGFAGLLLLAASGCGAPIQVPELTDTDVPKFDELANIPHRVYRIEPGDTVEIQFTYHPEMKHDEVVRPDGKISPKLLGDLAVAGLTTEELRDVLVRRTSDRLRNPEVTVRVSKFADRGVYVGGEVGKPGLIPYQKGLTPLQAIITAGGFRDTARLDSVILVRVDRSGTNVVSRKINLQEVISAGVKDRITLAPHDVLYIPRSQIAEADLWVRQHIIELIPIRISASPLP